MCLFSWLHWQEAYNTGHLTPSTGLFPLEHAVSLHCFQEHSLTRQHRVLISTVLRVCAAL